MICPASYKDNVKKIGFFSFFKMTISPEPSSKGDITHRINFAQPI